MTESLTEKVGAQLQVVHAGQHTLHHKLMTTTEIAITMGPSTPASAVPAATI